MNDNRVRPRVLPRPGLASAPQEVQRNALIASLRATAASRTDLARKLRLSSPVVTRLVQGLLSDGWVHEIGTESSQKGRPRTILALNPAAGHLVSVLLGPGRMTSQIYDAGGDLVSSQVNELALPVQSTQIVSCLRNQLHAANLPSQLIAIGFSAPGVVTAEGAVVNAPDLGWDAPVDLARIISFEFGCHVSVENDVNLMMLAESVNGLCQHVDNALFLYYGARGVGLGILINGVIYAGSHGASGEIGQIPLSLTDSREPPRKLEDYYSSEALARSEHADTAHLLNVLSRVMGTASLLFDPSVIVVGGALRSILSGNTDDLHSVLQRWVTAIPPIEVSQLGEHELHLAVQTKCWDGFLATEQGYSPDSSQ